MKGDSVYFVGIGGIGMSALAQYFVDTGKKVSGSDREESPVTEMLRKQGVDVRIGQKADNVAGDITTLVYSDAVHEDNPERMRAKELGIPQLSYFKMLGQISVGRRTVAISGTHGKTTTTGMLAKILQDAGASPTAIIGSIVKDFNSNYVHGDSNVFVVEACEYRDHLLELSPEILVITNLEWDHTDWFPSLEALLATFKKAIMSVPAHGAIIVNATEATVAPLLVGALAKVIDYTTEPAYELSLPGEFNQMNARAAAAAARFVHPAVTHAQIAESLSNFSGTWRRFEYKGKNANGADLYDDYAHHPTAVLKTLKALRAKVSGKIIAVFHPHLYSRTRDLLDGFAESFGDADEVLIAPIYAAREVDDGTISSEILAERIRAKGVNATAATFDEIKTRMLAAAKGETVMTMGAGDIYKIADEVVGH